MNRIVFFLPDVVGGVFSVINNLLEYAPVGQPVSVIAYSDHCIRRQQIDQVNGKATFSRFAHHCKDNSFTTAKRLLGEVPRDFGCIVATDGLELLMVQSMRLRTPLVYIVLGDFQHYYNIAQANEGIIDCYIAISREIFNKLLALLPHRKDQIRLAYYSTPAVPAKRERELRDANRLKIIYVSRLEDGKNPLMLPKIDRLLKAKGLNLEWTIVGDGPLRGDLEKELAGSDNFRLTGFLSPAGLSREYGQHDIFLLPSASEGIPVSLIEAMKTGLVPVMSDIPGGVREIVTSGVNGFLCPLGDEAAFAACIQRLAADPELFDSVAAEAVRFSDKSFDPASSGAEYWSIIAETSASPGKKHFNASRPGLLDSPWLPNPVVRLLRAIR